MATVRSGEVTSAGRVVKSCVSPRRPLYALSSTSRLYDFVVLYAKFILLVLLNVCDENLFILMFKFGWRIVKFLGDMANT